MRRQTATICLTLAVLLGGAGVSVSNDGTNTLRMGDPKKTIILIYTHGSGPARRPDRCELYSSNGTPRVISNLDGKKINGNKILLHRFCTPSKTGEPIRSAYNYGYYNDIKVMKRRDNLIRLAKKYHDAGVLKDNIVLTGHSAGGFASLLAQAEKPDSIGMVIAFGPAFAGKRINRTYEDEEVDKKIKSIIGDAEGMNALVFSYDNDPFDRPEDLLIWKKNTGIKIDPIYGNSIKGEECYARPHRLVFDHCFFNKKSKLIENFIKQNSLVDEASSYNAETSSSNVDDNIAALEKKLKYLKARAAILNQIKFLEKKLEVLKLELETGK